MMSDEDAAIGADRIPRCGLACMRAAKLMANFDRLTEALEYDFGCGRRKRPQIPSGAAGKAAKDAPASRKARPDENRTPRIRTRPIEENNAEACRSETSWCRRPVRWRVIRKAVENLNDSLRVRHPEGRTIWQMALRLSRLGLTDFKSFTKVDSFQLHGDDQSDDRHGLLVNHSHRLRLLWVAGCRPQQQPDPGVAVLGH